MKRKISPSVLAAALAASIIIAAGCAKPGGKGPSGDGAGPELVVQTGHTTVVNALAFSRDGRLLATGTRDLAGIWEVSTGRLIRKIGGHTEEVLGVALSPDSRLLATASADDTVRLTDTRTGKLVWSLEGHKGTLFSVAFSPDGKMLASSGRDESVKIWDVNTGREIRSLEDKGASDSVAFSPAGGLLAVARNGRIDFYDVTDWKVVRSIDADEKSVLSISFSADGRLLASGGSENTMKIWNVETGGKLHSFDHGDAIFAVSLAPNGSMIVSGGRDGKVILWDVATGKMIQKFEDHTGRVRSVGISPDGKLLASGSRDHTVRIRDIASKQTIYTLESHTTWGYKVFFGPKGNLIAAGVSGRGEENTIKFSDLSAGSYVKLIEGEDNFSISPDGRLMVTWNQESFMIRNIKTGYLLKTVNFREGHDDIVWDADISSDGNMLVSASLDQTARLWDLNTGKVVKVFQGDASLEAVALSQDGKLLVTGDNSNIIQLWDAASGERLWSAKNSDNSYDRIRSIAFSLDGKTIASGSSHGFIRIWDVSTGGLIKEFFAHPSGVRNVVFGPGDKFLASSGSDGTMRLWEAETGTLACTMLIFDDDASLAYAPSGHFDSSPGADDYIGWTVGLSTYPAEKFRDKYKRPGLVSSILEGEIIR